MAADGPDAPASDTLTVDPISGPTKRRRGRVKDAVVRWLIWMSVMAAQDAQDASKRFSEEPTPKPTPDSDDMRPMVLMGDLFERVGDQPPSPAARGWMGGVPMFERGRLPWYWLTRKLAPDDLQADLDRLADIHARIWGTGTFGRIAPFRPTEFAMLEDPHAFRTPEAREAWRAAIEEAVRSLEHPLEHPMDRIRDVMHPLDTMRAATSRTFAALRPELEAIQRGSEFVRMRHVRRAVVSRAVTTLEDEGLVERGRSEMGEAAVRFTPAGYAQEAREYVVRNLE